MKTQEILTRHFKTAASETKVPPIDLLVQTCSSARQIFIVKREKKKIKSCG